MIKGFQLSLVKLTPNNQSAQSQRAKITEQIKQNPTTIHAANTTSLKCRRILTSECILIKGASSWIPTRKRLGEKPKERGRRSKAERGVREGGLGEKMTRPETFHSSSRFFPSFP